MRYGSFVAPGWSYTSYPGWVSWGLMGGGVLAAPSLRKGYWMDLYQGLQM